MTDQPVATTYRSAAATLIALVSSIPDTRWEETGLGTWSVRTLAGHAGRSLWTVVDYGARPAGEITIPDAAAYYAFVASVMDAAGPDIDERAVQAGLALGDDPSSTLRQLFADAEPVLGRDPRSPIVTFAGVMPLAEFLRTRVLELVVHGLDLSVATGIPVDYGESSLRTTLELTTDLAIARGLGPQLALQMCGRQIDPTVSVF